MNVELVLQTDPRKIAGIKNTLWQSYGLEIDWITIFCPNYTTFLSWVRRLDLDLPNLKIREVKNKKGLHGIKYHADSKGFLDFEIWTHVENFENRTNYYIRMSNRTCVYFFANLYIHPTYDSLRAASSLKRIDVKMVYKYRFLTEKSEDEILEKLANDLYQAQIILDDCTRFQNLVTFTKSPEGFTVSRGLRNSDPYFFRVCVFPERLYYELEIKGRPLFALSRLWKLNDIEHFLYKLISIYQSQGKKLAETGETWNYQYDLVNLRSLLLPLAATFEPKRAVAIEREILVETQKNSKWNLKEARKKKYIYCSPFVFSPVFRQPKSSPIEIVVALYSTFLSQKLFSCLEKDFSEKIILLNFFWYKLESEIICDSFFTFSVTAKELCVFLGWDARTENIKKITSCLMDLEDWDPNYTGPKGSIQLDFFIKNLQITRDYKIGYIFSMTFNRNVFRDLLSCGFLVPISLVSRFSSFYRQKEIKGRTPSYLYFMFFYILYLSREETRVFTLDLEWFKKFRIRQRKLEVLHIQYVLEFLIKNQIVIGFQFDNSADGIRCLDFTTFYNQAQKREKIHIHVSFESRNYSEFFLNRLADSERRQKETQR